MQYVNINFYSKCYRSLIQGNIIKSNIYTYKNEFKLKLKKGSNVIVRVRDEEYAIGIVDEVFTDKDYTKYSSYPDKSMLKSVIGLVDLEKVQRIYKNEKRLKELNEIIGEKLEKINKLNLLKQLADNDEEIKELVKEYEELINDK